MLVPSYCHCGAAMASDDHGPACPYPCADDSADALAAWCADRAEYRRIVRRSTRPVRRASAVRIVWADDVPVVVSR